MAFEDLDSILRIAGPIFTIGMQISAVETGVVIHAQKSVGNLSIMPFLSLFLSNTIWSLYGYLRSDLTVLMPAICGVIAGFGSTFIYNLYSPKAPRLLFATCFLVILYACYLYQNSNVHYIGYIGSITSVIVMGSPLMTLRTVITERSTAAMPFHISLSAWLNAMSKLAYGVLIADDPIIYFPNLVGLLLTSIQMSLYVRYGFPTPQLKPSA
mmetsp:Transcript_6425/g.6640  ORF Transcript_6425/g.6640 Transcript_6425/m.6640 type:complete len:212 (+) Transcript_6425:101-736(+)